MRGKAKPDSLDLLMGTMNFVEKKLVSIADRFLKISLEEAEMVERAKRHESTDSMNCVYSNPTYHNHHRINRNIKY